MWMKVCEATVVASNAPLRSKNGLHMHFSSVQHWIMLRVIGLRGYKTLGETSHIKV